MNLENLRRMSWKQLAIIAVVGFCGITSCIDSVTGKQKTKTTVNDATVTVVATAIPTSTATIIPPTEISATQVPPTETAAVMEPTIEPTLAVVAIVQEPTKIAEPKAAVSSSDSFPCADGQIKGNINSSKYHVPGGQSYAKTVDSVICFNTAQEAESAGFIRAKR